MVNCVNCPPDERKSYTGKEPSPNGRGYSATFEVDGKVMKGKDGLKWQVTPVGSRRIWKLIPGGVCLDIPLIDNGGTSFIVRLSRLDRAYIYEIFDHISDNDDTCSRAYNTPDEPWDVVDYSLGTAVLWRPLVVQYKAFIVPEDMSSVLFRVGPRQYIFAGAEVICFSTEDDIREFHSCLGNSAVPYGFAVGERNTYFLADYKKMDNKEILRRRAERDGSFNVDANSNRLGLHDFKAACDMGLLSAWDPYQELWWSVSPSKSPKFPYKVLVPRPRSRLYSPVLSV